MKHIGRKWIASALACLTLAVLLPVIITAQNTEQENDIHTHEYKNGACSTCGQQDTRAELFRSFSTTDFFLKEGVLSDGEQHAVAIHSNTNNARVAVIPIQDGATYDIRIKNNADPASYRMKLCTFAEDACGWIPEVYYDTGYGWARYLSDSIMYPEEHVHDYQATTTPPTCTEKGYVTLTCTLCKDTKIEGLTVDVTGRFVWNEGYVISAISGSMMTDRNWIASDYVDISAFDSIEIVTGDTVNAGTTLGLAFYDANKNFISGAVHTDKEGAEYGILVHNLEIPENAVYLRTTWYSVNHETYNGAELHTFYCKGTGTYIPALGHSYSLISTTAPTCAEQGTKVYSCATCGDEYAEYIPETEHAYDDGVCTACGVSILGNGWLAPDFAQGDYTMIVLPDTQNLISYWPDIYYNMADWIVQNKDALNIQAVLHMGDMVNSNNATEWTINKQGMDMINAAGIPWMPMRGNHDDSAWFNRYYDYATYGANQSWFGGSYEQGKLDHTYWFVTAGQREYLILSLGWAPSWDVLAWAQGIVEQHSDKNVIINCHAYINKDGTFLDDGDAHCVTSYLPGYPDGDDVWAAFAEYENVVLAMGGHIHSPEIVTRTDINGAGQQVTSMLIDRQNDDISNRYGMVAVLTFRQDSNTVQVNWYSTRYDALYHPDSQFAISVPHVNEQTASAGIDITDRFTNWTEGGPVLFRNGLGYGENGFTDGSNRNLKYSDFVCIEDFEALLLTICAREGYGATGGFAFYTDADPSTFISYGSAARTGNGEAQTGTLTRLFAVPEGARYVRVTYWVDSNEYAMVPFSCIGYKTVPHAEHDYTVTVTEQTCIQDGKTTYTCTICNYSYDENVQIATGHSYTSVITPPTCTEAGYTTMNCERCGDSYLQTRMEDISHLFAWTIGQMIYASNGNCAAYDTWRASDFVDISAYRMLDIVTADTIYGSTSTGLAFYDADKNYICGITHTDGVGAEYGILVHKIEVPENAVYIRSTWYAEHHEGYNSAWQFYCLGDVVDEIAPLGHDYHAEITQPTCTEKGYTTHTCITCGDNYVDTYTQPTEHGYDEWQISIAPTCTEKGEIRRICASCGDSDVATLKATGHMYQTTLTAPTCTEQGFTTHTCHCGDSYVDTYTDALGHVEGEWTVVTEPQIGIDGCKQLACTVCGEILQTETIPALPEQDTETEPEQETTTETEPETEPEQGTTTETEPETESETESATQTEPETESETESATQTEVEPETVPDTAPTTEPDVTITPDSAPETDSTDSEENSGGCKSVVYLLPLIGLLAAGIAFKKRKND